MSSARGSLNSTHSALSPYYVPLTSLLLWLIRAISVDFLIYLISGEEPSSSREGRWLLKTFTPSSLALFHENRYAGTQNTLMPKNNLSYEQL